LPTKAQQLLAEGVGTALLVFVGAGAVATTVSILGAAPLNMAQVGMIAFAFMTVITVVVYSLGHISGAHINPAVTFGLAAAGRFDWKKVPGYITAQLVGGTVGAFAIVGVMGRRAVNVGLGTDVYSEGVGVLRASFAEGLGTFMLVLVVLGVTERRSTPGFAGLAIGMTVFAVITVVGPVTGASINPARHLGPMFALEVFGVAAAWSQLLAYLVGPALGALAAATLYRQLEK
jgi:glycerol uptake facilitator protein